MRSQHYPLSIEEYHRLPKKLGWKYEYWDGQVHISPSHRIATVTAKVIPCTITPTTPYPPSPPYFIRSPTEDDTPALISAYLAAFSDDIEYCDWEPEQINDSARKAIQTYFTGERGNPHPASVIATTPGTGELIGAALLVQQKNGLVFLDMLYVIPAWQHQGVATALLAQVMNALHDTGIETLGSRYMLGNDASMNWHQQHGFSEEPDLFLTGYYYHWTCEELRRQEAQGDLTPAELQALHRRIADY